MKCCLLFWGETLEFLFKGGSLVISFEACNQQERIGNLGQVQLILFIENCLGCWHATYGPFGRHIHFVLYCNVIYRLQYAFGCPLYTLYLNVMCIWVIYYFNSHSDVYWGREREYVMWLVKVEKVNGWIVTWVGVLLKYICIGMEHIRYPSTLCIAFGYNIQRMMFPNAPLRSRLGQHL